MIANDAESGGGFGGERFILLLREGGGIDQEGIFIAVLLFAQFNVLVVLHSNRLYDARSLSQSRSLCTLVVCKFKFLTYHLRDNFLGVYRKIIAIGSFRFFWIYAFLRDRLFGSDYFGDIKSLSRVSWMCPCVIYNLCIHSPFLHPVASSWLTHTCSEFSNKL